MKTLAYIEQRGQRGNLGARNKDINVCFPKNHGIRKTFWHYFFPMSNLIQLFHYLCSVFLDDKSHKLLRPVWMLCLEQIS